MIPNQKPIASKLIGPRSSAPIGEYVWKKEVAPAIVMDFVMFSAYHE